MDVYDMKIHKYTMNCTCDNGDGSYDKFTLSYKYGVSPCGVTYYESGNIAYKDEEAVVNIPFDVFEKMIEVYEEFKKKNAS